MGMSALKLSEVFAVLKPNLQVGTVAVSSSVYAELDADHDQFKQHVLVSAYEFSSDWPSWERHPAGDEIVLLLSGKVEMVLRRGGQCECVALTQSGTYVVVPAGVWHTARTSEKTSMLFVTPGEGTEHRTDV